MRVEQEEVVPNVLERDHVANKHVGDGERIREELSSAKEINGDPADVATSTHLLVSEQSGAQGKELSVKPDGNPEEEQPRGELIDDDRTERTEETLDDARTERAEIIDNAMIKVTEESMDDDRPERTAESIDDARTERTEESIDDARTERTAEKNLLNASTRRSRETRYATMTE